MHQRFPIITYQRLALILMLFVVTYFATRFSATVVANHRLDAREAALALHVKELEATNQSLKQDLEYDNSRAYAEYAARNQLGLMMPGDHVIRVAAQAAVEAPPTPTPALAPPPARSTAPTWRRWWYLFAQSGS